MKIFKTTENRMNTLTTATGNNNITRLVTALYKVATAHKEVNARLTVSNTHIDSLVKAVSTLNNSGIKCVAVSGNIISTNNINTLVKAVYDYVTTCDSTITTQTAQVQLSRKHIDFLAHKHAYFSVASMLNKLIDSPVAIATQTADSTTPAHFEKLHRLNRRLSYNISLDSMDTPTAVEFSQLSRKYNTLVNYLRFKALNSNSHVVTYTDNSTQGTTAHKDRLVYECRYIPLFDNTRKYKTGDKVSVKCDKYLSHKYINQLVKAFCDCHKDSKKAKWGHSATMLKNAKKKKLALKDFTKQAEKDRFLMLENSIKANYGITDLKKSTIQKLDLLRKSSIKKWDKISDKKLLKSCYNALDVILKSATGDTSIINVSADVVTAHKGDFDNLLSVTTDSTQKLDNGMLTVYDLNKVVKAVYGYFDNQVKTTRNKTDVLNADLGKKAKSVESLKKTFNKVIFNADFVSNFVQSELSQGKTPQQALTSLFMLTLTSDGFVYGNVYNKNKDLYNRGTIVKEYVSYEQLTQKNDDNDLSIDFGSLEDFKTYKASAQIENKLYNLLTTENRFFKQAFFDTAENKSLLDDEIQTVKVNLLDKFVTCGSDIYKLIDFLVSELTDRQHTRLKQYLDSNTDSNTDSTVTKALQLVKAEQFYCGKIANRFINSLSAVSTQKTKYDSNGDKIQVAKEGIISKNHYIFSADDVAHQRKKRFSLVTKFVNENNLVNVKVATGNRLTMGRVLNSTQYGMLLSALNRLLKFNYNQMELMQQLIYSYSDDKGILSRIAQIKSGECATHDKTKGVRANLTRTKLQIQRKLVKGLCNDTTRKFIDDVVESDNKNSVDVIMLCKFIDTLNKSLDDNTIHQLLTAK